MASDPRVATAAVRACLMLTVQAEGASVVTVEDLTSDEALSPLQTAFSAIPGRALSMKPDPGDPEEI
jgi:xanthine dehydrogenase iron-sulfur cluster and FAD-binding subunit A